uniref:Adenosine kinase n=1 Tax=Macrostomum lignano TaxID=282301 RepID=A0A1I8IAB3_9PLAT
MNSIRVAQWLLSNGDSRSSATGFLGAVGTDEAGQLLFDLAGRAGLQARLERVSSKPTGICAALITGQNRTLVTRLGAALHFSDAHLASEPCQSLVNQARMLYIGGFFFSSNPGAIARLVKLEGPLIAMNLHATFLCENFANPELLSRIDLLFGNEREALTLARHLADCGDAELAKLPLDCGQKNSMISDDLLLQLAGIIVGRLRQSRRPRVVFTHGAKPLAFAAGGSGGPVGHPVPTVEPARVRDTNGCGDAFVGGFLAGAVEQLSDPACVRLGQYAAEVVIEQDGCSLPDWEPRPPPSSQLDLPLGS